MISTLQTRKNQRKILYQNSLIWSIGNILTSSTLINCMLRAMGFTSSFLIASIYAVPFLCKILQLILPRVLESVSSRKNLCIRLYYLQSVIFLLLVASYFLPFPNKVKLGLILSFWGVAGLFEVMAYSVFLSWNRQLFPGKTLGRFYSRREYWKLIGEVIPLVLLMILNFLIYLIWGSSVQNALKIPEYSILMLIGAAFIIANTLWLRRLPDVRFELPHSAERKPGKEILRLLKPFQKKEFWPFLIYGGLFSFCIQAEQVSQFSFQYQIMLALPFGAFLGVSSLRIVTRGSQIFLARWIGKQVDRFGTVNIMIISQILTAIPLLFYSGASVTRWWWLLYIAALIWISYAGLNAALPKLQTDFSDPSDDTPWIAAYGLAGSLTGIAGVYFGAWIHISFVQFPDYYFWFFLLAFVWRLLLAFPLLWAKWQQKKSRTKILPPVIR